MLMQQVREVMTVNQEKTDESSWICLTSEQMGFPLRSEFANENHKPDNLITSTLIKPYFFWRLSSQISFETQKGNASEKLEDALEMLDLEWSKHDDTKTQCNRLHTSPPHRGNASNKNGPALVKRRMQWEAHSKPLAVDDPPSAPARSRSACRNRHKLVFRSRDTKKRACQNPIRVATLGRTP